MLPQGIWALDVSADGTLLLTGGWTNSTRIWRIDDFALLRSLRNEFGHVHDGRFSPDGRTFALGCAEKVVRLYRVVPGN